MNNKYHLAEKLKRYRHIINIITKYGFGIIIEKIHLNKILKIPSPKKGVKEGLSPPVRVRKMLEELGPTFIKLGQILSTRPDLVPLSYIKELEKLQDSTLKVPFEKISRVFVQETKKEVHEVFSYFEETPFASASISQVHKAKYQNTEVAVKIQKPGIEGQIKTDISIMHDIAELIEKFIREADIYQPVKIVKEFEKILKKELDFTREGRNIEIFKKNFEQEEDIYVPFVCRPITSRRVLVTEYVHGIKINRIEELEKAGADKKKLSEIGLNSMMKQIFADGFFHGDPHPANILVTKDDKLCFIDFGIVGKINDERRLELIYMLEGLTEADSTKLVEALDMMGALKEDTDTKSFIEETEDMLDKYRDLPIKEIDINNLIEESFSVMRKYYIRIPANLSLLVKTLITIEGIGLALNPDFSIASGIKPHVLKFLSEKIRIKNFFIGLRNLTVSFSRVLRETPASIDAFLKMLKKGYINIAFEHKGLQDLISTIHKSSNRVAFSLIIASMILSSSLIMVSGVEPFILGYPALGVIGFFISAVLGILLIISILKNRSL